jgi:hypothetical protein
MKILLLVLAITAAEQPQQFDLICKSSSGTTRYRVDLAASQWCWEQCRTTWKIAEVEPRRITFNVADTPSHKVWNWVDRSSGEWFQGTDDNFGYNGQHGHCESEPFSGFPEEKTRF